MESESGGFGLIIVALLMLWAFEATQGQRDETRRLNALWDPPEVQEINAEYNKEVGHNG